MPVQAEETVIAMPHPIMHLFRVPVSLPLCGPSGVSGKFRVGLFASVLGMVSVPSPAKAEQAACRMYDVLVETVMPHLEENLRQAAVRELRCLMPGNVPATFPLLGHPALQGCRLGDERQAAETASYSLLCGEGSGTNGSARWERWNSRIMGTLEVKLGGKNMTLIQRITMTPSESMDTGAGASR